MGVTLEELEQVRISEGSQAPTQDILCGLT